MSEELILVVEDDPDIQELLEYTLLQAGYRVDVTDRGEEGLEIVREHLPSLIVLDLMLPGLDGLEVCRRLKADEATQSLPVIILTAKGEEEDVVAGFEAGADDYITKPFSPKVLIRPGGGGAAAEPARSGPTRRAPCPSRRSASIPDVSRFTWTTSWCP